MSEISAYEKMFEDGSAYKPIDIDQPSPDNESGRKGADMGADPDNQGPDYSLFDNHMENMIKEKAKPKQPIVEVPASPIQYQQPQGGNDKIASLERRIALLEQALGLVMETQTKLMRG